MLRPIFIEDQYVVQVNKYIGRVLQDGVHQPLKRLCRILHSHAESLEIEKSPGRCYACLWAVPGVDQDLVERLGHIHLAKNGGPRNLVSEGSQIRQRIQIQHSLGIQQPVVPDRPE